MRTLARLDLRPAVDRLVRVCEGIDEQQFERETPCADMDVRDLLAHLMDALFWAAPASLRADHHEVPLDPDGRWRSTLKERATFLADAWAEPDSWRGTTGTDEVQVSAQEGGRAAGMELVIHGWDLARATDQPYSLDADVVDAVVELLQFWEHADDRDAAFDAVVPVDESAPALHRALGLSGRNPHWRPAGPSTEMHGTSRISIHEGKLDEFKRLAAECVEIVRSKDNGTIEFNLYLNPDSTECFVHERFRDSAAGLEHMRNIGRMMERLSQVCTITGEVCGTPSPELRAAIEAAGVTLYAPLESA